MVMVIHDSARKHGIADEDIRHAVEHALVEFDLDDQRVLHLGFDRQARMLEVVVLSPEGGEPIAIHAMPIRRSYLHLLP